MEQIGLTRPTYNLLDRLTDQVGRLADAMEDEGTPAVNSPSLDDITTEDTQRFAEIVRGLDVGDIVVVTSNRLDFYIKGVVIETNDDTNGYHDAIIKFGRTKAELHANWRDIPEGSDDQDTPYTGLLIEPFDDTAPAITDIEVVSHGE